MTDPFDEFAPDEELEASAEDAELRDIEARIKKLKKRPGSGQGRHFARGIALATTMGFVVAGCLLAGMMLGEYLKKETGSEFLQLAGILFGLAAAAFSGSKLLRPFLRPEESDGP